MVMRLAAQGIHGRFSPAVVARSTAFQLLELPPIADEDDSVGFYWGAAGHGGSHLWGTVLHRSTDGGANYHTIEASSTPAVMGQLSSPLAAHAKPSWDRSNSVRVKLFSGRLLSATGLGVMNGANLASIGGEIIAFCQAQFNASTGIWTLRTLRRGLFGTDGLSRQTHETGEAFVLLNRASVFSRVEQASAIGLDWLYAVTNGTGTAHLSLTGRRIKPHPVCHAMLTRTSDGEVGEFGVGGADVLGTGTGGDDSLGTSGATGDATIWWVPRRRVGFELLDGEELGVDEPKEDYSIDVVDDVGNVLRTITDWTPVTGTVGGRANVDTGWRKASYPVSQQLEDGVSDIIIVNVYQKSSRIGRGIGREIVSDSRGWITELTEAATAAASTTSVLSWASAISEAAAATDTTNSRGTLTEAASALDTITRSLTWSSTLTEAGAASDIADWRHVVSESASSADAVSATFAWSKSLTEAASAADAYAQTVSWSASITEAGIAQALPSEAWRPVWNVGLTEAADATDQS